MGFMGFHTPIHDLVTTEGYSEHHKHLDIEMNAPTIFGYMGGVFKLPLAQGPMVPQYWCRATEPTHCGSAAVSGPLGPDLWH